MSAPDLLAALEPVVDVLERLGVRYQIGGSVASSAYGMARATMDVDLVADLGEHDVDALVQALGSDYFVAADSAREAVKRRSSFNLIHQATMLKVVVFVSENRPYDTVALSRGRSETLVDEPGARAFRIASPEDVVLAKLSWYRLGGEVSEVQWADVVGVLRVQREALDFAYLKEWAGQLEIDDLLARAASAASRTRSGS